ncbi:MAG: glycogen synthase GlgA [Clostridia bacterium]|nr:glycogen synthase GlgA [Clostridia bacterium]
MKVLFATSEAYPFAVSGGLGDVAYALPKALRKKVVGCRVIMPLYTEQMPEELKASLQFITNITVPVSWRMQYCGIFQAKYDGVTYILLDNEFYFKRASLYGEFDDAERFAFFARAVLEAIPHIDFNPDVIHCNDWQTALVPPYYRLYYYNRPGYENIKTIMTIHNIQYQGRYSKQLLEDVFGIPNWAESLVEYDDDVNLLKGGIESADRVTTVSPTYANEIMDPWFSYSLDRILRERSYKLSGILNGIDVDLYNPETDKYLAANFSADKPENKAVCKADLQRSLGLPENPDVPIVAMVTRLASHKGLELVKFVFDELMAQNIQFVLLGSGEEEYEMFFHLKSLEYEGRFAFRCGFDPALAHKIYAGSDIFLMPSKQEPCGLSQMIALRYGCVPVVRQTGGLNDTILDAGEPEGVGYTFKTYNAHDMAGAMYRAIGCYANKKEWKKLTHRGMATDNSWVKSAGDYLKLYKEVTGKKK